MPMPERTTEGFPVIPLDQAQRDRDQVHGQVSVNLAAVAERLRRGEVVAAAELVDNARGALDWLADRLAITEGGTLGRRRSDAPSTGDIDTPA